MAMINYFHCFVSTLFLLTFYTNTAFSERCHPNDKKALLKIKKYLNTPPNNNDSSAWDPNVDCCEWYQVVSCDDDTNRTTVLNLLGDLNRPIPAAVFDLVFLEELYMPRTNLTGEIPQAITNLSHLRILQLGTNHLSGKIPSFLSQIKTLLSIDLSYNRFTGSIPASLSQIPNLKIIDVSRNKLEGDVSFLFGKNKSLIYANFSRNSFEFDFSKVDSFPVRLDTLDLSHNRITGRLPEGLVELDIGVLDVSYNRLCGKIPVGGRLQTLLPTSYSHNRCLCGAPLPNCK